MRLIGLLCFYDEPIENLIACIASLHQAGVEELVAVDGAYALYEGGKPASASGQHAAIHLACRELGMGCVLHVPGKVWANNEVEKRTFLFSLGLAVSVPGDWFFVMDADQVVIRVPDDFKQRLQETDLEVAEVEFLDVVAQRANQLNWPPRFAVRCLFRAQKITVGPSHCIYDTADGRHLWGQTVGKDPEPVLAFPGEDVLVEHRPDRRPTERQLSKLDYYQRRDAAKVERGQCEDCLLPSDQLTCVNWRMTKLGLTGDWKEVCDECAPKNEQKARARLRYLGIDPDTVVPENRNGAAPDRGAQAMMTANPGIVTTRTADR